MKGDASYVLQWLYDIRSIQEFAKRTREAEQCAVEPAATPGAYVAEIAAKLLDQRLRTLEFLIFVEKNNV